MSSSVILICQSELKIDHLNLVKVHNTTTFSETNCRLSCLVQRVLKKQYSCHFSIYSSFSLVDRILVQLMH
jgi:hypothetical protein